jgi:hypothetical protein
VLDHVDPDRETRHGSRGEPADPEPARRSGKV